MSSIDRGLPRLAVFLALCILAAACDRSPASSHDPRPLRMVPAWGMSSEPVSVVIQGENFLPLATQHLGGEVPVTMDHHFEAFLGEVALEDVTWVDARTLRARVPAGIAQGWHVLKVVGPLGGRVELPRAYLSSLAQLARLEAGAVLERGQVSVQTRTRLTLTVENTGTSAALAVTPVLRLVGEGRVEIVSEPAPADIAAGGSASFAWELGAVAPGEVHFALEIQGSEELTGTALRAPDVEVGPLRIRERAVLSASFLAPEKQVVNVGQRAKVSLRVTNTGETGAIGVVPTVSVVTGSVETAVSGPVPGSVDLSPGASQEFAWEYVADGAGTLAFQVDAVGRDASSGVEVRAPEARSADISVQRRAELAGRFLPLPTSVNVGQEFVVEVEVKNTGDSALLGVTLKDEGALGNCGLELVPGTTPWPAQVERLPGNEQTVFRARLIGKAEGSCAFRTGARGVDETDGVTVELPPVSSSTLQVRRKAALTATLSAPSRTKPGNTFDVTLTVSNTGSTVARGVKPTLPESSSGVAEILMEPADSGQDVAGGARAFFTWRYRATRVGKAFFKVGAGARTPTRARPWSPGWSRRARSPSCPKWSRCSTTPSGMALPSPTCSATTAVSTSAPTRVAPVA
ncbi:hypothetical protein F0U59_30245 [Archangium gephyra]|nr:hypothetical protein F0U59_30245 [Archangium gephyra]